MAEIKIKRAFLNRVKHVGTGTIFELGESFSKKNEAGDYTKDGDNTYYEVWVDRAGINPEDFNVGDVVTVEGWFRTKKTVKGEKTYYDNVVSATLVAPYERVDSSDWATANVTSGLGAVAVGDAPF